LDWLDKNSTQYYLPSQITSSFWLQKFKEDNSLEELIDRANDNIQWNNDMVAAHMKQGRSLRQIVADSTLTLNPLYCYCVALEDDVALAELLVDKAVEFLKNHPHYRQSHLAVIMPKGM
jgi:hypothetical protein